MLQKIDINSSQVVTLTFHMEGFPNVDVREICATVMKELSQEYYLGEGNITILPISHSTNTAEKVTIYRVVLFPIAILKLASGNMDWITSLEESIQVLHNTSNVKRLLEIGVNYYTQFDDEWIIRGDWSEK